MTCDPKTEVQSPLAAGERRGDELNTPQETLSLLKILALGDQDVAAGKAKPVAEIVARLGAKRTGTIVRARAFPSWTRKPLLRMMSASSTLQSSTAGASIG
jgi:hypothetical protein